MDNYTVEEMNQKLFYKVFLWHKSWLTVKGERE